MSLFVDTPHDDKDAFRDFLFANALSHSQIAVALEQGGKPISVSPITDMGDNAANWLDVHARMHEQEFVQLGLTDMPDLRDVDFEDAAQYHDWMELHAIVHVAVNQALGLN